MKAVWLSSTYYLDEAVANLSPNAERMLTRAIAFCGSAESRGFLSELNIKMLGLPNPKKLANELADAEIFERIETGGYYFRSWEAWNSSGDKLLDRRKADRERQQRHRTEQKKSREQSREKSRDVTPPEESRAEKTSAYVGDQATDPNAHGIAATPGADLVREIVPKSHPSATQTSLRWQASELLNTGTEPAVVRAALRLWCDKPSVGIGRTILASLCSEVIKARAAPAINGHRESTSDRMFRETQALKTPLPQENRAIG